MSMLNFQINRAGRGLTPERWRTLERAKGTCAGCLVAPSSTGA